MAKQSINITSFEELPAILNAKQIAGVMGLSIPIVYSLISSEGFPLIKVGKRLMVEKMAFITWLSSGGK
jgi:predicted DNA-binding transcriptional regulator AlpA